jgi:hypothetical protein
MRRIAITTIYFALAAAPASAQVAAVRVQADSLSVGEWTELVVAVAHQGVRRAVFPDETGREAPPEAIGIVGDFELLSRLSSGSRTLGDGSRLDSVVYRATTFALDSAWAAPVVGLATETDTAQVAGVPLLVPVRSVVPPDAEDILDITPIAEFPRTWWPWLVLLAVVVATILVGRRYLRRPPAEEPEPEPVPEPAEAPLDEALRRLAALARIDVASDAALKPFFVELSDILRTYVARRTGVPALEMTTGELVRELRGIRRTARLPDERVRDLDRLLQAADLVKFADLHPAADSATTALHQATATVRIAEQDLGAMVAETATDGGAP